MDRIVGVVTTGIYCLEGVCAGRPKPSNVRRFSNVVAAEATGLRACHQCRPYRREPMSTWVGTELICRAVRLILDGALHGGTEDELAEALGVSARHLRRRFLEEVGTTPVQLARSSRAHFARRLLDDTDLTITEIAFAAGFGSVRQFNRTMRSIFRQTPRELRARRRKRDRLAADGGLALRLPTTRQVAYERYLCVLEEEAVPGVESVQDGVYRRTIEIEGAPGVLEITPGDDSHMVARLHLPHWEGLIHHVRRARRIFRLDDHVHGGDDSLCGDGPIDLPGTWDPFEVGVRSILRRTGHGPAPGLATLVEALGTEVHGLDPWGLGWLFPSPRRVALAGLEQLGGDDAEVLRQWGRVMENSDRARIDRAAFEGLAEAEGLPRWLIDDVAARLP